MNIIRDANKGLDVKARGSKIGCDCGCPDVACTKDNCSTS